MNSYGYCAYYNIIIKQFHITYDKHNTYVLCSVLLLQSTACGQSFLGNAFVTVVVVCVGGEGGKYYYDIIL